MTWQLGSFAVLALALAAGFGWYERAHPSSKVLALVATLAALAALGRVAFAPLPNVKPTTDIVLLSGFALGGAPGFAVGAVAALASNLFFGQGPWTPWQMLAWGGCGAAGAAASSLVRRRVVLAALCFALGLAFSSFMDVWNWLAFYDQHTWQTFVAVQTRGLPFDVAHALGNVVIAVVAGPELRRLLERYGRRLKAEVVWA
jgi:energy-coupling factor transport system substrate-specific component